MQTRRGFFGMLLAVIAAPAVAFRTKSEAVAPVGRWSKNGYYGRTSNSDYLKMWDELAVETNRHMRSFR